MKNAIFWFLAIALTLATVVYQRKTGPTNPLETKITISGKTYSVKLPRSLETEIKPHEHTTFTGSDKRSTLEFDIPGLNDTVELYLLYKRYPSKDAYTAIKADQEADLFSVLLPSQPPAGKIAYYISVNDGKTIENFNIDNPVVLRFKNSVPAFILIPHIILMFLAMLFANFAGIIAFTKSKKVMKYSILAIVSLALGGLVLGPIVQNYAFGAYWTGWPFGHDLTDNKTLIIFVFWLIAILLNRKKSRKYLFILAALLTLGVYAIPHSVLGSEYQYEKSIDNR